MILRWVVLLTQLGKVKDLGTRPQPICSRELMGPVSLLVRKYHHLFRKFIAGEHGPELLIFLDADRGTKGYHLVMGPMAFLVCS